MDCNKCIVSVGRSGSKWIEKVCQDLDIPTKSNRVDIGVRVELPAVIFAHLTDELYESKIVYRTEKFEDLVRTFCMNPNGIVVNENTNGIEMCIRDRLTMLALLEAVFLLPVLLPQPVNNRLADNANAIISASVFLILFLLIINHLI